MTNHWNDIGNTDAALIIGSNAAENHPVSFKYVTRAMRKRNAKLMVADPRYTRTAAKASVVDGIQLYSQLRSGTDIAFMLGMMRYAMKNGKINKQYLKKCTNALFKLDTNFRTCDVANLHPGEGWKTGIFSGLEDDTAMDFKKHKYNKGSTGTNPGYWSYQYEPTPPAGTKQPLVGANLYDVDTVLLKLWEHVYRYDVPTVSSITGADPQILKKIYKTYTDTYPSNKSGTIMYAMGSTQHTYGTQNVRSYAIMQLLLGNTGVAGGGINALRGESNVQGSTDMCLLYHILPGYLAVCQNTAAFKDRTAYHDKYTTGKMAQDPTPGADPVSLSWWRMAPRYIDSLLQAWWPKEHPGNVQPNLDTAYGYLPKIDKDHWYTHIDIFEDMVDQTGEPENKEQMIYGLMCWGQNPAVGGPSSSWERYALKSLEWLVCVDLWETETAAFWKPTIPGDGTSDSLGIPGTATQNIGTEVYMLPAAASYEKEGSVTNSGRWSQWRYKCCDAPGKAIDDLSIMNELGKRIIASYQGTPTGDPYLDDPIANLWWGPYCRPFTGHVDFWGMNGATYDDGAAHPGDLSGITKIANPHKVSKEINGYWCPSSPAAKRGKRVDGFWGGYSPLNTLQTNGETSSGNWLYCSHYVNPGDPLYYYDLASGNFPGGVLDGPLAGNRQEHRDPTEYVRADGKYIGLFSKYSVCWPVNRRIIYNGASVYQPGHASVGQPLAPDKWVVAWDTGGTAFRAGGDVSDGYKPPGSAGSRYPFIMLPEGVGKIFGPGRADGPFPEHYEPWETVLTSNVISDTLTSPTAFVHPRPERVEHADFGDPHYPIICTTYRLTEHWQAGQMTRNNPWLCQLMPSPFVEMDEVLASNMSISNGDSVRIHTKRSDYYTSQGYGKPMMAIACVTKRFKPYYIAGDTYHHIGLTWHWGYTGLCKGDSANLCCPHVGDANTGIPESKAFICDIEKV